LIEGIWRGHREVSPGALDVLVNSLRGKLDAPFPAKLLHTIRGKGYLLKAEASVLAQRLRIGYMRKQIQ
jgi:DNA-binding response OmpR family regulator